MKKAVLLTLFTISLNMANAQEPNAVQYSEFEQSGIEMKEALNADGTDIIKRPYYWFAGIGTADTRQMALEIANREAYATVTTVINNNVENNSSRGGLSTDGKVATAVKSYWKQVSQSVLKGCAPYGKATVEYDTQKKMYTVTARVAIRGDRFLKLLGDAEQIPVPAGLTKSEAEQFIEVNQMIIDAAKGE